MKLPLEMNMTDLERIYIYIYVRREGCIYAQYSRLPNDTYYILSGMCFKRKSVLQS